MNQPLRTTLLDQASTRLYTIEDGDRRVRPRMAVLGSPGSALLRAGICAASIARGFDVDLFDSSFHTYPESIEDESSELCKFRPDIVLMTLTGSYLTGDRRQGGIPGLAKQKLGASLVDRAILSILPLMNDKREGWHKSRSPSLFDYLDCERCRQLEQEDMQMSFLDLREKTEMLVSWQRAARWRQPAGKKPSKSDLLAKNHIGGLVAAVWGLSYTYLAVDMSKHPLMLHCAGNIASRVACWALRHAHNETLKKALTRGVDALILVDHDPYKNDSRAK